MESDYPLAAPAGFVPLHGLAFDRGDGTTVRVGGAEPLPVTLRAAGPLPPPLTGSIDADGVVGPFVPVPGRAVWLTLTGEWRGSVELRRAVPGSAGGEPLTLGGVRWGRFTAPANEAVVQEDAADVGYWLHVTLVSGTLGYRVAQ